MRKETLLAFVGMLVTPISSLYVKFIKYRKAKLYQLMITPQKCYLERLLNDRFDYTQRRIYIDDGIDKTPLYIFINPELKPKYIFKTTESQPKYIYTSGESGIYKDDFVVFVPVDVVFDTAEMSSLVKAYKLAGTKFKIQLY